MAIHLILGGARSGKSGMASRLAVAHGLPVVWIATARAGDAEMAARIARHRESRPPEWRVIEEPLALAAILRAEVKPGRVVVVDCLTLWLTNLLFDGDEGLFDRERRELLQTVPRLTGELLLVSNETGLGVVPLGEITRRFVDESGWLHQELARLADRVTLMVAGLPLSLKGDAA
ncbi:MAG: bifunctional adenosylcobinamide kinase/adenosylcobinamide-phosphate guanylyltransferase [Magnetococcus sp. YQC-9]